MEKVQSPLQLGALIRRRRKAIGRSQAEIAEAAGLRQATLSSAEAGAPMHVETLFTLLTALKLELTVSPKVENQSAEDAAAGSNRRAG